MVTTWVMKLRTPGQSSIQQYFISLRPSSLNFHPFMNGLSPVRSQLALSRGMGLPSWLYRQHLFPYFSEIFWSKKQNRRMRVVSAVALSIVIININIGHGQDRAGFGNYDRNYQQMQNNEKKPQKPNPDTQTPTHGPQQPRYNSTVNRSATQAQNVQSPSQDNKTPTPFALQQSNASLKKQKKINQLMVENKRLRISNKQLKKQLQQFEKRLDETLKKRTVSEKKPRVAKQLVENMQLKNAYKQCEIYKRQVAKLKKKEQMFNEQNVLNMTNQIAEFEIERQKFMEEIKGLKKLAKQQEKGLVELTGTTNYMKVYKQLEQLKQQNKKLNQKLTKQDRDTKLTKLSTTNQKRKAKQSQQKEGEQKKKEEEKQNSQLEILKQKAEKDNKKIGILNGEISKLNENCEEYRRTIEEKDKEIAALRLRLGVLRKQTKLKHSRLETEPSKNELSNSRTLRKTESKTHHKLQSSLTMTQAEESKQQQKRPMAKYPRLMESGSKNQSSFKWNHHQFSSKIKQVQVCSHPNGHIKQVNFRYERGQPAQPSSKANFIKFTCEQNSGQYIRNIRGGFKDDLLRYLILETSTGRSYKYCQHQLESQCANFSFGDTEGEYPGAFFGENSAEGVNRIGCLIQCIK